MRGDADPLPDQRIVFVFDLAEAAPAIARNVCPDPHSESWVPQQA
jgi:hypothetical protein